jgi:L-fucose isomerase-like protein
VTAPRVGFITCVHPIYNLPLVLQQRDQAVSGLRNAGCDVLEPEIARDPRDIPGIIATLRNGDIDLLLFFFCTWVDEDITLSIVREMDSVPRLLWALPYFDLSIPMPSPMTGLTATGCNLRRAGRSFLHQIGKVTPGQIHEVARIACNAAIVTKLRRAKFGIFGGHCPGMLDTVCDASLLQKHLGPTVVRGNLDDLIQARDGASGDAAIQLALQLIERTGSSEVPLETLADHGRMLLGMQSLIQQHQLNGFAVRCWPELRDIHRTTICLAMAELAESGIVSACESDLTALATAYILASVSRQPNCTLEITAYLEEENALQFAHCGSAPLSLASNPARTAIRGHMRTGSGVMLEFGLKPGMVTIAKLLRPFESGMKMFIGRGEVIPTNPTLRGNVATIRVEPSPARFIQSMLDHGVEHHLVIVYGDWMEDLSQIALFAGIELIHV